MWWQYLLVFAGALLVDVVPFPLPPAFTIMVLLQLIFDLNIWVAIAAGVAGSIAGRWILSLYVPKVSSRLFKKAKNDDVQYLGRKMKEKGWKGQALVLVYSLMPLPTTPLFLASGMARLKPWTIIPPFVVGKCASDTAAVLMGKTAVTNLEGLIQGMFSWKSIAGVALGLLLIFAILFFDWRSLLQHKKLRLKFAIWR